MFPFPCIFIRGIKKAPTVSDDSESPFTYQLKIRIKKEVIVIIRLTKWRLINRKETVLIKHSKIMEENFIQLRMTGEDLIAELRSKNIFNITDVEFAVMETNGPIRSEEGLPP